MTNNGPVKGAPPTLEWIGIDRLTVDPTYQRATDGSHSRKIIFGMVKCWDWSLCQPLVVSRRPDGALLILDGQHRHAGATERGDIPHLPCVVLTGCDQAAEAETFVALNTKRQKLSQTDIFNGMLAAGDGDAKQVADLLAETGWKIARSTNAAGYGAGYLACAPMLVKASATAGFAAVRNALTALREAYPETAFNNSASLLKPLISIYRDGDLDGEDPDAFIEALGTVEPGDWDDYGREQRKKHPMLSRVEGLAAAMLDIYREHARAAAA